MFFYFWHLMAEQTMMDFFWSLFLSVFVGDFFRTLIAQPVYSEINSLNFQV